MNLDGCPSLEEEPLSVDELWVYAHWRTVDPTLSGPGLTMMVRRACYEADTAAAVLLARTPRMTLKEALVLRAKPPRRHSAATAPHADRG